MRFLRARSSASACIRCATACPRADAASRDFSSAHRGRRRRRACIVTASTDRRRTGRARCRNRRISGGRESVNDRVSRVGDRTAAKRPEPGGGAMRKLVRLTRATVGLMAALAASISAQPDSEAVAVDADDIGGVVTGPNGPEGGVWVIAETDDLPTKFRKIVVTDDRGRYLVPDLPAANYVLWVRGYGLVDSPRVRSERGRVVALPAVVAPDARAAAQVYPASYWYSLIELPTVDQFPGTGA